MRGDGGNHHEKLGQKIFLCATQLTIPDTAGTTADPVGKNTDRRSSKPNQASHTADFSYPLVSSIFVPIFIPHLSFSTIIAEHKVKSTLSISPCHDHDLTLSTAYTKYSIHRLVDSLFPSYVLFLFSHIQNHSHARTVTKSDQNENSKRPVKQRCCLGGAEAAPPGLSPLRRHPPNDVEGVLWGVFW